MKELSLREIQLGQLNVLKKLAALCDTLGVRYYLFYGTLIGAIRHGGFIPWDDDIDVMMPRPDYEKLLAYCAEHAQELKPFVLMNAQSNAEYIYPISRLCDTRYYVDYAGVKSYGLGLFVDIYPFDGCGNTPEEAKAILASQQMSFKFLCLANSDRFAPSNRGALRTVIRFGSYVVAKLMGFRYYLRRLEQTAKSHAYADSKYVACSAWELQGYFERADLEEAMVVHFEDADFTIPAAYDKILRQTYGDYMQLPPEADRIAHHYYTAYLLDSEEN